MPTVVVGYVPKPEGRAALERAIAEAELRGADVRVVSSQRGGASYDQAAALRSEEELGEARRLLESAGVTFEIHQMVRGNDPADDLIGVADEYDAELIVIGLRRRSPVGKLILGSSAQRILLDAACPVLAVKA
jgi:nucleotide-binding universal stress UspA family protein